MYIGLYNFTACIVNLRIAFFKVISSDSHFCNNIGLKKHVPHINFVNIKRYVRCANFDNIKKECAVHQFCRSFA